MTARPDTAQREAIREAAHWYALLASGEADEQHRAQWQIWHDGDPVRQWAWARMQRVNDAMGRLPQRVASSTLLGVTHSRRRVLYGLALLLGGSALGNAIWRSDTRREWMADYRSAVGERREVEFADGTRILLDTDSAVDVQYDDQQRLLTLRRGEILVTTGSDPQHRPFMVATRFGRVLALGTRFTVRVDDLSANVAVLEKAVQLFAGPGPGLLLEAGQQAQFGPDGAQPPRLNDASVAEWEHGSLIAIDEPLGRLVARLSRYRPGILQCDPEIVGMKVSGAFPIDNTDHALDALQTAFPVQVVSRTRYWVTLTARGARR